MSEFNRVRAQIRAEKNIYYGLSRFKATAEEGQLRRLLPIFVQHPGYRALTAGIFRPFSYGQLGAGGYPKYGPAGNEIIWSVECLRPHGQNISSFLRMKEDHDEALLEGDLLRVEELLKNIEGLSGVSLWLAEATINFLQRFHGYQQQREFADRVQATKGTHPLIRYVVSWLSYRASQDMKPDEFYTLLNDVMPLDNGFAVLTHILLGNSEVVEPTNLAGAVAFSDIFPPVDRYLLITKTLQAYLANFEEGWPWLHLIVNELAALASQITDPYVARTLVAIGGQSDDYASQPLIPIYDAIAMADYDSAARALDANQARVSVEGIYAHKLAERLCNGEAAPRELKLTGPAIQISDEIEVLLSTAPEANEAATRLLKIAFANMSCSWAASLALIVETFYQDDRSVNVDRRQLYLSLRCQHDDPRFAFLYRTFGVGDGYLSLFTSQHGPYLNLIRACLLGDESFTWEIPKCAESSISEWRSVSLLRRGDFSNAATFLRSSYENESNRVIKLSLGRLLVEALLRDHDLVGCSEVAVGLFLESAAFAKLLPFERLVNQIIKNVQGAPSGRDLYLHLSIVLTLDVFSRHISLKHEADRVDAFKDFLVANGVRFASELVNIVDEFPRGQLVQFLKFVCVPEILDQSLALDSTRAVEDERSRILVLLSELTTAEGKPPSSELLDELSTIKTKQVVRETTLRLDQSKIYVNVDGIKRTVSIATREAWRRYALLTLQQQATGFEELQKAIREALGERIEVLSLTLPLTEANKLFARMVFELRDLFTTSKEFGLDANLSTNIRHGFVMREIRGPLLQHHLVTNKVSVDGGYQTNQHWIDRLGGLDSTQLALVSRALDAFSEKVDAQIEFLNRRLIRIKGEQVPEGLFDFTIDDLSMQIIKRSCEKSDDYDEFIDIILDALWSLTTRGLDRLRKVLSSVSQTNLLLALEQLQEDLRSLRDRDDVAALLSSANLVRPDLNSAIKRVASWFTLSGNTEYQDYDLQIAYEAGLATVKSYYSHLSIHSDFNQKSPIMMMGRTLPFLSRLFSIILDNSAYHSGLTGGVLRLAASANVNGGVLSLAIGNNLAGSVDLQRVIEKIEAVNSNFGRENAARLIREEGGSGYPKIWKILAHDLGGLHAVHVSLTPENEFLVEIMIDAKGILL